MTGGRLLLGLGLRGETMDQAKVDRRLKRFDTDGDGSVNAAELQAESSPSLTRPMPTTTE